METFAIAYGVVGVAVTVYLARLGMMQRRVAQRIELLEAAAGKSQGDGSVDRYMDETRVSA